MSIDLHATYMNNKSAPIPAGTRPEVERFLHRLGYRLVLRGLSHDAGARAGAALAATMVWENVGVAPPYRGDRIAFRLKPATGAARTIVTGRSIRGLIPGRAEMAEDLRLPADLEPGEHELEVGVVDPATGAPAVRLAIAGRDPDGWYPVSSVTVTARKSRDSE